MNIKIKEFKEKQKNKLEVFKEKQKNKLEVFKEKQKNILEKQKNKLSVFKEKQKIKLEEFKEKQKIKLEEFKEKQKIKLEEFKEKKKKVKGGTFNQDYDYNLYVEYIIAYFIELEYAYSNSIDYTETHINYMKNKIKEVGLSGNNNINIYKIYITYYKTNFFNNILTKLEPITGTQLGMIFDTIIKNKNDIIKLENNFKTKQNIKHIFDDLYEKQNEASINGIPSAPTPREDGTASAPTLREPY